MFAVKWWARRGQGQVRVGRAGHGLENAGSLRPSIPLGVQRVGTGAAGARSEQRSSRCCAATPVVPKACCYQHFTRSQGDDGGYPRWPKW